MDQALLASIFARAGDGVVLYDADTRHGHHPRTTWRLLGQGTDRPAVA